MVAGGFRNNDKLLTLTDAEKAKFWTCADRSEAADGCWEWRRKRHRKGYGIFIVYRGDTATEMYAHRLAFTLTTGSPPVGIVCHRCNNTSCIRPDHLYDGTPKMNSGDMVAAGRVARGERQPHSKLTVESVASIRAQYATGNVSQYQLAAEFGVRQESISAVVRRTSWKHVP